MRPFRLRYVVDLYLGFPEIAFIVPLAGSQERNFVGRKRHGRHTFSVEPYAKLRKIEVAIVKSIFHSVLGQVAEVDGNNVQKEF